jgi:hypothetical protein
MLRTLLIVILTFSCLYAVQAANQTQSQPMTADDLIKKNIDAHGGLEKLRAIHTLRLTGRASFPQGLEAPFVLSKKRPGMVRLDTTMQGQTIVQAYDGQNGWIVMPFGPDKGPQKMGADDEKDIIEQADFDGPLVDYKEKGNSVELMGKEVVEGTDAFKIKITLKDGNVLYLFIHPDTGLEIKETSLVKKLGVEGSLDTYFRDYKTVDGLTFPYTVELKSKEAPKAPTYRIDKVETNMELDDAYFQAPKTGTQTKP